LKEKAYLLLILILASTYVLKVKADRGMIPIIPGISVYEPGQKAIIGWNGEVEMLILSTDVYSPQEVKVLEILPLPSNPDRIEKASFESFHYVNGLIIKHAPRTKWFRGVLSPGTEGVTILFKTKIGVHDITVVRADESKELTYWIQDFLKKNGLENSLDLGSAEQVIDDYISAGFQFFVLDIIEVSDERSVEPILYEFRTPFLYYPLKISSIIPGETRISLFLITPERIGEGLLFESNMQMAYYELQKERAPVQFKVSLGEIGMIDPRLADLFDGEAWFTVIFYEGRTSYLENDLKIAYPSQSEVPSNSPLASEFVKGLITGFASALLLLGVYALRRPKRGESNSLQP